MADGPRASLERITAQDLDPVPGVLHGLTYPLVTDLEGMMSPLFPPLLSTLARSGWPERMPWLRVLGLDALVLFEDPQVPGLRLLDAAERAGVTTRLHAVADPAPEVWSPDGKVKLLSMEPDRIEIEVESGGGVAVVRRAYQQLLVARTTDGGRLPSVPADRVLLGVQVPPGKHRVTVEVSAWPEILAGAVALLGFAGALAILLVGSRRSTWRREP